MPHKYITQQHLQKAINYSEFKILVDDLLKEGKVTGPEQSEHLTEYTKMNVQRMHRNEKTVHLQPELIVLLQQMQMPLYWLVITEGWCGDSAQILPVLAMMADAAPNIELKILLRDENLELMDKYLTNNSRSIPILICLNQQTLDEVFVWGPRPQKAQEIVLQHKLNPQVPDAEFKNQVHLWYAKNKGEAIQHEFIEILKSI